jgi:hypothetical protein
MSLTRQQLRHVAALANVDPRTVERVSAGLSVRPSLYERVERVWYQVPAIPEIPKAPQKPRPLNGKCKACAESAIRIAELEAEIARLRAPRPSQRFVNANPRSTNAF